MRMPKPNNIQFKTELVPVSLQSSAFSSSSFFFLIHTHTHTRTHTHTNALIAPNCTLAIAKDFSRFHPLLHRRTLLKFFLLRPHSSLTQPAGRLPSSFLPSPSRGVGLDWDRLTDWLDFRRRARQPLALKSELWLLARLDRPDRLVPTYPCATNGVDL